MKYLKRLTDRQLEFIIDEDSYQEDELLWDIFIVKIISYRFLDRGACVITWNPQKDSIAHDLPNLTLIKGGNLLIGINSIPFMTSDTINLVANSIEFMYGNIKLTDQSTIKLSQAEIINISDYNFINDNTLTSLSINEEMIWCDSDGKSLYWFNPSLPINQIEN
jgi:hypothetical protein